MRVLLLGWYRLFPVLHHIMPAYVLCITLPFDYFVVSYWRNNTLLKD